LPTTTQYFEIRKDDPPLFWCESCGEGHCCHCKATLPQVDSEEEIDSSNEEDNTDGVGGAQTEIMRHLEGCSALAAEKKAL
jgi:hypothetical protein